MTGPAERLYVIMGVAGAGKTRIGKALARALGVPFVDADDHHPPENVARMAAGVPLTDAHRVEWLSRLAERLRQARSDGSGVVLACSALRRAYRDVLRAGAAPARPQFIVLSGARDVIAQRLRGRRGHFMPESLLDSQLDAFEAPAPDEQAWECDIRSTPPDIVAWLLARAS